MGLSPCLLLLLTSLFIRNCLGAHFSSWSRSQSDGLREPVRLPIVAGKMLPANLVAAAFFLMAAFSAITATPHIRERHIIRVPLRFKIIHHHKIQKVPIIIRKHVHYYKEKQPVVEDTHSNHIFHEDSKDDFHFHQEFPNSGISYDHLSDHVTHDHDYDEEEQSQEDEYENDEYE